ncbi:PEP/pyruvate-binding domain-containing protein, partial [Achromobacter xylosoxidans]
MTTAAILDWATAREAGVAGAGGKGWQLARMAQLGIPVPPGFVLAASASLARRPGEPMAEARGPGRAAGPRPPRGGGRPPARGAAAPPPAPP